MKKILSVIILFLLTSSVSANDRNIELDKLFLELKKIFHLYLQELHNRFGRCGVLTPQIKN
jgi:hypothetical protein